MPTPIKILELKGDDWMKGHSFQSDLALGGLFQTSNNFDPFDTMGILMPGFQATKINSGGSITVVPKFLQTDGAFMYALGDKTASDKALYKIDLSNYAMTDLSADVFTNISPGVTATADMFGKFSVGGLTYFIYGANTAIRSVKNDGTGDVNILSSANLNTTYPSAGWCLGDDANFYYTATNSNTIGKITNATGTSGNTNNAFVVSDTSFTPKDVCATGRYLCIIADTNPTQLTNANFRCNVQFWDYAKAQPDVIWPVDDDYLVACRFVNGAVHIIGRKGIWVCNSATPPKLVWPFTSQASVLTPTSPAPVTSNKNVLYWVSPTTTARTFAYGSLFGKPVLYQPFLPSNVSSDLAKSICVAGGMIFTGTDLPEIYVQNSTRGSASIETADTPFSGAFAFAYAKVSLRRKLSSGQSVSLELLSQNGDNVVSALQTKQFSDADIGAKQSLIFLPKASANQILSFEELAALINTTGAGIKRVAIYGTPQGDADQI